MIHRPYEAALLKKMWALAEADPKFEGWGSGKMEIWLKDNGYYATRKAGRTGLSRASVIFALDRLVAEHVLGYEEATGKGGYRRIYRPIMSPEQYEKHIYESVNITLGGIFTGEWWRLP